MSPTIGGTWASRHGLGVALAAIGVLACSGDGEVARDTHTDTGAPDTIVEDVVADAGVVAAVIGPAGGTLSLDDGAVALTVPPGALAAEQRIAIELADAALPPGYTAESPIYRFEPDGLVFAVPAEVTIRYRESAVAPWLYWTTGEGFAPLDEVAVDARAVTGQVTHFSKGVVASFSGTVRPDHAVPCALVEVTLAAPLDIEAVRIGVRTTSFRIDPATPTVVRVTMPDGLTAETPQPVTLVTRGEDIADVRIPSRYGVTPLTPDHDDAVAVHAFEPAVVRPGEPVWVFAEYQVKRVTSTVRTGPVDDASAVAIGGVAAQFTWDATRPNPLTRVPGALRVIVPEVAGDVDIGVTTGCGTFTLSQYQEACAAWTGEQAPVCPRDLRVSVGDPVLALSPSAAIPCELVTVTREDGSSLAAAGFEVTGVEIGNHPATLVAADTRSLQVRVPDVEGRPAVVVTTRRTRDGVEQRLEGRAPLEVALPASGFVLSGVVTPKRAHNGDVVRVTATSGWLQPIPGAAGRPFTSVSGVRVSGFEAPFEADGTSYLVTVPAGASSGPVALTSDCGTWVPGTSPEFSAQDLWPCGAAASCQPLTLDLQGDAAIGAEVVLPCRWVPLVPAEGGSIAPLLAGYTIESAWFGAHEGRWRLANGGAVLEALPPAALFAGAAPATLQVSVLLRALRDGTARTLSTVAPVPVRVPSTAPIAIDRFEPQAGAKDTRVSISARYRVHDDVTQRLVRDEPLLDADVVRFDQALADFSVDAAGALIEAVVPADAASGYISIETFCGSGSTRSCTDRGCTGAFVIEDDCTPGAIDCADPRSCQPCVDARCAGFACDDGDACTGDDRCQDLVCRGTPIVCDDGLACTVGDFCLAGTCHPGSIRCDDGDLCTTDGCDPGGACTHVARPGCCTSDAACEDGDVCTTDRCVANLCRHDARTGCCREVADCDDGNTCTIDGCEAGACRHDAAPTTAACDDGSACTAGDHCASGRCQPGPLDCDDADACTFDSCVLGQCRHAAIAGCCRATPECDDGDVCTTEACVANTCVRTPVAGCCHLDGDCDDGDACTADTCAGNVCGHVPIAACCRADAECDDGAACTRDTCTANRCAHAAVAGCCAGDGDCADGDLCTLDRCTANTCDHTRTAGCCTTHGACNDDNPCTTDRCILNECSNGAVLGNPSCDDGDACTTGDVCAGGTCAGARTSGPGCTPPEVVLVAPEDGASVPAGRTIVVEADATDADGIARVRIYLDEVEVAEDSVWPYRQEVMMPMSGGPHTLAVDAVDGGGAVSDKVTITLDVVADAGTEVIGRVIDEGGDPIAGADVSIVDAALATTTGDDGRFTLGGAPTSTDLRVAAYAVHEGTTRFAVFGPFAPVPGGTTDAGDLVLAAQSATPLPYVSVRSPALGFTTRPGFGDHGERAPLVVWSAPVGFDTRPGFGDHGERAPLDVWSAPVGFDTRPGFGDHGERAPLDVWSAPVGFATRPIVRAVDPPGLGAIGLVLPPTRVELRGLGFVGAIAVAAITVQGSPGLLVDPDSIDVEDDGVLAFEVYSAIELEWGVFVFEVTTPLATSWSEPTATLTIGL